MGFPIGYAEVFSPNLFLHTLSLLGYLRNLIFTLLRYLGLSDFMETEMAWSDSSQLRMPITPSVSAILIREFLPVIKFAELGSSAAAADPPECCPVCLDELEGEEEIRWLTNCKHIFHRACLDRWMDHDHETCPLCRTPFVPQNYFHQRRWIDSGATDFYSEYSSM